MAVITIARQYGAGGSAVGRMVADRLGADFVDKELIEEVARRAQLAPEAVLAEDEHPSSLLGRLVASFGPLAAGAGMAWEAPYPDPAYDPRPAIMELTRQVILEVARTGNAVIVGRGASVVLHDRRDVLHVFLYAAEPARVQTVMQREALSEAAARRRVREMDSNRAVYLRQVHHADWRDAQLYTLQCNTGVLGYERTAEIIVAATEAAIGARPPVRASVAGLG
jgi:cytidylate kinase